MSKWPVGDAGAGTVADIVSGVAAGTAGPDAVDIDEIGTRSSSLRLAIVPVLFMDCDTSRMLGYPFLLASRAVGTDTGALPTVDLRVWGALH